MRVSREKSQILPNGSHTTSQQSRSRQCSRRRCCVGGQTWPIICRQAIDAPVIIDGSDLSSGGIQPANINFSPAASSLTSAGAVTATTAASLTNGFNEAFFGGLFVDVIDTSNAPCVLDKNGTGRLDCHLTYATNGAGPEFIFYQVGNGNPPLLLDADSNLLGGAGAAIGDAYPVSTPVSFNGDYGLTLTQCTFGSLADFSGQMQTNGLAQTLSGTLDVNTSFVNPGSTALTGTFSPSTRANVLNGTLTNPDQFLLPNASGTSINVDYYFIDANRGFFIETDLNDPVNPSSSVSLGYFGTRTPVCHGCP